MDVIIDLSVSAWRSSVWRNLLRENISMGVSSSMYTVIYYLNLALVRLRIHIVMDMFLSAGARPLVIWGHCTRLNGFSFLSPQLSVSELYIDLNKQAYSDFGAKRLGFFKAIGSILSKKGREFLNLVSTSWNLLKLLPRD